MKMTEEIISKLEDIDQKKFSHVDKTEKYGKNKTKQNLRIPWHHMKSYMCVYVQLGVPQGKERKNGAK